MIELDLPHYTLQSATCTCCMFLFCVWNNHIRIVVLPLQQQRRRAEEEEEEEEEEKEEEGGRRRAETQCGAVRAMTPSIPAEQLSLATTAAAAAAARLTEGGGGEEEGGSGSVA